VVDLARHCGYLPLALRIVADRVAARSDVGLADVSGDLACEQDRLDLLATVDDDETTAVRAVFSWSFRALPADAARMFRLLGLHAGAGFSVSTAAALAGTTVPRVRPLLAVLSGAHLLEQVGPDRYRLHDLLRVYAAERATSEETDHDRAAAVGRVLALYLQDAIAAGRALDCGNTFDCQPRQVLLGWTEGDDAPLAFTTHEQALAWFKTEWANLVAAVGQASDAGEYDIAWKLPLALAHFFEVDKPIADWIGVHHIGLAATRCLHDRLGEAWILADLGSVHWYFQQFDESLDCRRRSLAIVREIGFQWGAALMLCYLAYTLCKLGRFDEAVDNAQQALVSWRALGNQSGEAFALNGLGDALRGLQQHDQALAQHQRALAIQREIDSRRGEGTTLRLLGLTYQQLQRHQEAIDCLRQAAAVYRVTTPRRFGSRLHEAETLCLLGDLLHDNGQPTTASECWRQAHAIYDDIEAPQATDVAARIARLNGSERSRLSRIRTAS
jgi:tetratricopeptide (TPR) repeat protein